PDRKMISLAEVVDEVRETLGLAPDARIGWISAVERGLMVDADHDQLLRVLLNLARNAVQALDTRAPNDPARDQIRITGRREGARAGAAADEFSCFFELGWFCQNAARAELALFCQKCGRRKPAA